jgi:hypothetical protein
MCVVRGVQCAVWCMVRSVVHGVRCGRRLLEVVVV